MPAEGSWWRIGGRSGLERAEIAEAAGREPGAGELTLSLRACGLDGSGSTGGVAGVVTAVGPDVEHVAAGGGRSAWRRVRCGPDDICGGNDAASAQKG